MQSRSWYNICITNCLWFASAVSQERCDSRILFYLSFPLSERLFRNFPNELLGYLSRRQTVSWPILTSRTHSVFSKRHYISVMCFISLLSISNAVSHSYGFFLTSIIFNKHSVSKENQQVFRPLCGEFLLNFFDVWIFKVGL